MTLQDALVAYRTYARAESKSPKTVDWVTSSVRYFSDFLGPERQDIANITGNDLRHFIIALQSKNRYSNHPFNKPLPSKLSPQTILTYCRAMTAFFSFLHGEGFIPANPMAKVKLPKVPEKVVPTFTEKQIERLLAQPDRRSDRGFRDYTILLTFIDTGIRLSELANLKVGDIDCEQNYLRIMGKGGRERYVPFGRRVAKALLKYQLKHRPEPVGTDNFWLRRDGEPLSISVICGHTARYENCHYPMVGGATIIGVGEKDEYVIPRMARVGDKIIITKGPAIEATGIFATMFPHLIEKQFGLDFSRRAQQIFYQMSVVEI